MDIDIFFLVCHAEEVRKAFAYLRVSGKGQVQGDGFPRQIKAIKEYAAAHNIQIAKPPFKEEGISGATELDNRPALMKLLEALAANGTKLVLIERLDRLARDLMVQESIIADLRKRGYELISVTEPDLLQDDPMRKFTRQIFGGLAEYEKAMIVAKLRGARDRVKATRGKCEGAKKYGEWPGEAPRLQRMKDLRAEGLGFDRIAAQLNAEGIPPRRGQRWHGLVINQILTGRKRSGHKAAA
jgi:DNA invertase Pin-like site-specific DNA recombinase